MIDKEAFEAWWKLLKPAECDEVEKHFVDCWQAAIAHERSKSEIVVTKNESGQIVAVTRQDDDHRILSVIAESAPIPTDSRELEIPPSNVRPAPHATAGHVPSPSVTLTLFGTPPIPEDK